MAECGGERGIEQILGVQDRDGAVAEEFVGAAVALGVDRAGNHEHVAALFIRVARGPERTTLRARFDHERGPRDATDQPVAFGEAARKRGRVGRVLGKPAAPLRENLARESPVAGGRRTVQARGQEREGRPAGCEGAAMGGCVDAVGETRHDRGPGLGELRGKALREFQAGLGGAARADDRDDGKLGIRKLAAQPEHERRVRDFCEQRREIGFALTKQAQARAFPELEFRTRRLKQRAGSGPECAGRASRAVVAEFRRSAAEDPAGFAVAQEQLPGRIPAQAGAVAERDPECEVCQRAVPGTTGVSFSRVTRDAEVAGSPRTRQP